MFPNDTGCEPKFETEAATPIIIAVFIEYSVEASGEISLSSLVHSNTTDTRYFRALNSFKHDV